MAEVKQGEIWQFEFARPDRRRPVLVLTRQDVLHHLSSVTVAPITRTIRGLPNEVVVGTEVGLKVTSAVNLDNVTTVPKAGLKSFVGTVSPATMEAICRGLCFTFGCGRYAPRETSRR